MSWKKSDIWNGSYLSKVIQSNRLAHAYIFLGPDQQKKVWLASALAKTLFCTASLQDYCDECPSCRKVTKHNHPDVMWLRPVGATRVIKMEMIRELQSSLSLKSFEGGRKLVFILNADRMREDAANAMLKTIEEPSAETIIILMANDVERILPTIISRCQQLSLPLSSREEIKDYLVSEHGVSDEKALMISSLSRGNYSLANRYLDDKRREMRDFIVESVFGILENKGDIFLLSSQIETKIIELVKNSVTGDSCFEKEMGFVSSDSGNVSDDDKKALEKSVLNEHVCEIFEFIELCCRDLLVYKETREEKMLINIDKLDQIKNISNRLDFKKINRVLDEIQKSHNGFMGNTKLQFVLEILFDRFLDEIKQVV